jgi:uncharacterized membrane protein
VERRAPANIQLPFTLPALTDAVIAIIITIMVLEIRVPSAGSWAALSAVMPMLLSYVLSFVFLGIYWNNHHHMLHTCSRVTGSILWANLHLLLWLSLFPAATDWMDETRSSACCARLEISSRRRRRARAAFGINDLVRYPTPNLHLDGHNRTV